MGLFGACLVLFCVILSGISALFENLQTFVWLVLLLRSFDSFGHTVSLKLVSNARTQLFWGFGKALGEVIGGYFGLVGI